jgi:hypothetical protein
MVSVRARVASDTKTVRKDRRPVATAAAPSFNPLTSFTTDPVHGVWASDPLWVPPSDGGAVSSWRNGGSVGTPNFTQGTGSKQPTYRASTAAYNNKPTVQSDGTDDFLASNFADLTQPIWIVLLGNYGSTSGTRYLCDAHTVQSHIIYNNSGANNYAYGSAALATTTATNTNPNLHVCKFNGASSTYQLNGTTIASGNAGAVGMDGATILARAGGSTTAGAGHIAYYAVFTSDPTAQAEWAAFKAWVTSTYGITVA